MDGTSGTNVQGMAKAETECSHTGGRQKPKTVAEMQEGTKEEQPPNSTSPNQHWSC